MIRTLLICGAYAMGCVSRGVQAHGVHNLDLNHNNDNAHVDGRHGVHGHDHHLPGVKAEHAHAHSSEGHFGCGVGLDGIDEASEMYRETPLQTYGSLEAAVAAGFKVSAIDIEGSSFEKLVRRRLSTPTVENTEPIRVKMLYDRIDADSDVASDLSATFTCTEVGQVVDPCKGRWDTRTCPSVCDEKDVVTTRKKSIAKKRMKWAAEYIASLIRVMPRSSAVSKSNMNLPSELRHYYESIDIDESGADIVIINTLRKHDNDYVAGFAGCLATDAHNRCILGYFNFCPRIFDEESSNSPDVVEKERRTALHEIMHTLGAIKLDNFRDDPSQQNSFYVPEGNNTWITENSEELGKTVVHIRTPKVLAKWHEQTGCLDDKGPTLEDTPLGVGAHWESRILGSEVMSYGTLSGEVFLSDLTLAFLEDTGHYIANYSNAGRIVAPSTNTLVNEISLFGTKREATEEMLAENAMDYSPGWIRWGRGETCEFFTSQSKKWPKKYLCTKHDVGACTPDNRMAAICRIVEYGTDGMPIPIKSKTAQDSYYSDYDAYADTCWQEGPTTHCRKSEGGYPNVPKQLRPKVDDSGKKGGWNSAMDFAAVPAGYWNCQDQQPASTSSNFVEGGAAGFNFGDLVSTNLKAMLKFGGQTRCPNCRCFKSSLRELNLGLDFEKIDDKLGLCYRMNCATPNDLQIGIKGQFGTYWYDCPREGGQLYIFGFSGSISCPKAAEFCKYEKPSGMFNPATNPITEWIFLSLCLIIPFTIFCCCKCHPKLWSSFKNRLSHHHGFGDLHAMWGIVLNDIGLAQLSPVSPKMLVCGINTCFVMASVEFLLSIIALLMAVWLVRLTIFMLGAYLLHISWAGVQGARSGRPSAQLIYFVYGNMAISSFFWLFGLGAFLYPEILREFTLSFGNTLLPDDIDLRISFLGYILLFTFAVQLFGMISGMILLGHRVVAHANLILVNAYLFVLAIYGASYSGRRSIDLGWFYAVLVITPGVMLPLHTIWGTYSVRYKSVPALNIYRWMSFLNFGTLIFISIASFTYAMTEYARLSGNLADTSDTAGMIATDEEIESLVLKIYKAPDKCPPFRGTCRNAVAWSAYNSLIFCGMYATIHASLLALCTFAAFRLHSEKSMAEELLEDLKKHPSHADAKAFMLAKKLVEHGSLDVMAYADRNGGEEAAKRATFAKRRLASMFKGYRVKTKDGLISTIHMAASVASMKTSEKSSPKASNSSSNLTEPSAPQPSTSTTKTSEAPASQPSISPTNVTIEMASNNSTA